MAFIPTIKVARCSINSRLHGQQIANTLWFRKTGLGEITADDLGDLGLDLGTWFDANVLPVLSPDFSMVSVTCIGQDSLTAPSVESPFAGTGGSLGVAMPGNVCVTLKFNTEQRGRSGRGRNYISGLRELDVTGNAVASGVVADLVTAYNLLVSAPPTGWEWVVVSHFLDKAPREFGFAQHVLACTNVDLNVDSQRRRLTGRGN